MSLFRARVAAVAIAAASALPLQAQGLRDTFGSLFIFGPGGVPLFLAGTADPNNSASVRQHGAHFIPASVDANGSLISFISNAISGSASNAPVSAASSGTTFRFEGGVPVPTSISAGPLFAERAPTLGRGRVFVGFNRNSAHYTSLRGVPLNDIRLIFTHENVTNLQSPGCDSIAAGDCRLMGVPKLENDIMLFRLALDVNVTVSSFFLSYGLRDNVDISFALPIVSASLLGTSDAEMVPFGGPPAAHFFSGTPDNPVLHASKTVQGSATGVGDVAARIKWSVNRSPRSDLSLLMDARFPTGSEEDLLGSGHFSARGLAVVSARFGAFTPHANVGYLARTGAEENDALLATAGFDHLLAPWATLAFDVISEFQVGANKLTLPGTVTFDSPYKRSVQPSSIPEIRDNIVNASFGLKVRTVGELMGVANAIVPLNRAGLRPNLLWTFGLEYGF